jgi:serine-type D-Ala-D-Ala carboxypeptidase/endopeptidase
MPASRRLLSAVVLLVGVATAVLAAPVDENELHTFLVERVDGRKWGTAVAVGISSPQGRQTVSYGTLSVQDRRKVGGDTVFEIASLTKVFTALVLADMVARKQLRLDASVGTCLPVGVKLPEHGGRQITFLDLATHTSGLPLRPINLASQTALNKYAGYTVEQLYQGLASFKLSRDPGSAFEYSNWGFALLGHALAHCAGKSYAELLAERVTGPLGMRDTMYVPGSSVRTRLAAAYDSELQPVPNQELGALYASGGLYSTVDDMLKFIDLFLGRGPQPLVAAAATMLEPRRPGDDELTRMALGWRVEDDGGVQTMWSSGRADGYRSFMAISPQARQAVVAFTNAATLVGVDDIGRHVLDPRVTVARAHRWISVAPDLLDRYVGRYKFKDGGYLTVERQGSGLILQLSGQEKFLALAITDREFFPRDGNEARFVFSAPDSGPAQSLVLSQDGRSYQADRIAEESKP